MSVENMLISDMNLSLSVYPAFSVSTGNESTLRVPPHRYTVHTELNKSRNRFHSFPSSCPALNSPEMKWTGFFGPERTHDGQNAQFREMSSRSGKSVSIKFLPVPRDSSDRHQTDLDAVLQADQGCCRGRMLRRINKVIHCDFGNRPTSECLL
jgi:hypothetical protein